MKDKKTYKHGKAVRSVGELNKDFYYEFDEFDRIVFSKDAKGYWSFSFYEDKEYVTTPHMVFHKYFLLYNPEI